MKLCGFDVGLDHPFFLIAGPCVIESEQMALDTAGALKEMTSALGIPFIYKSSFDKANRSSGKSFRGLGMEKGLEILATVKKQLHVPVLTDVHEVHEIKPVAAVVDVIQTPAFLCRQTDFIRACAQSGIPVNIKKGQFLAPGDMKNVIDKARAAHAAARNVCRLIHSFNQRTLRWTTTCPSAHRDPRPLRNLLPLLGLQARDRTCALGWSQSARAARVSLDRRRPLPNRDHRARRSALCSRSRARRHQHRLRNVETESVNDRALPSAGGVSAGLLSRRCGSMTGRARRSAACL